MLAVPKPGLVFAVVAGYEERCPRIATVLTREMVVSYLRTGRWTLAPGSRMPATGSTIFDGLLKAAMMPEVTPAPAPAPPPAATPVPVPEVVEQSPPRLKLELPSNFNTPDGCEPPGPLHDDAYNREQAKARRRWVVEWFAARPGRKQTEAQAACRARFGLGVQQSQLPGLKREGDRLRATRAGADQLAPVATPAPAHAPAPAPAPAGGGDPLAELALAYARAARTHRDLANKAELARQQFEQAQADALAAAQAQADALEALQLAI